MFFFFFSNLFNYLFQHRALHYNLHYLHSFTYIIDKSFFFLLNTIFSTMKILTATTNTLLQTIYTQNKTQDKRTQKQRGWVGTYLGQSMLWVNIGQKLIPFPKMFCKFVSACCTLFFYLIYSFDLGFIDL